MAPLSLPRQPSEFNGLSNAAIKKEGNIENAFDQEPFACVDLPGGLPKGISRQTHANPKPQPYNYPNANHYINPHPGADHNPHANANADPHGYYHPQPNPQGYRYSNSLSTSQPL